MAGKRETCKEVGSELEKESGKAHVIEKNNPRRESSRRVWAALFDATEMSHKINAEKSIGFDHLKATESLG